MKKLFIIPFICLFGVLAGLTRFSVEPVEASSSIYNMLLKENGNYKLLSVKDYSLSEYRIYASSKIDEIDTDAFKGVTSSYSVMVSNYVTTINKNAFSKNCNLINYTGTEEEWNLLKYTTTTKVNYYSLDEGFINFWNKEIRPEKDSNICGIDRTTYGQARLLYSSLKNDDLNNVNSYVDKSGATIKDSMEYLTQYFSKPVEPNVGYLPKSQTISIIIAISVIGMSAIAGLYLLKKKKIIE